MALYMMPNLSNASTALLPCFNRLLDQFLATGLFQRPREDLGLGFGGNQQNSINVAK